MGDVLEGCRLPESPAILDFGCGPGRILSRLARREPAWRFFGCDIDHEAIEWAKRSLGGVARFEATDPHPPLPYPAESFDAVYAISVFTHLDEALQLAWLAELGRILRPGGALVATTHGPATFAACDAQERRELDRKGFVYRRGPKGILKLDGLPAFYQTTFHTPDYVALAWGAILEVERHTIGGMAGHHDVIVLRSPGKLSPG
jgi:SAM-dependent methyltransferase